MYRNTQRQVPAPALRRCRLFLKRLKSTLKIPVLALVDSDPYGLKILSVYMKVRTVRHAPLYGKGPAVT